MDTKEMTLSEQPVQKHTSNASEMGPKKRKEEYSHVGNERKDYDGDYDNCFTERRKTENLTLYTYSSEK